MGGGSRAVGYQLLAHAYKDTPYSFPRRFNLRKQLIESRSGPGSRHRVCNLMTCLRAEIAVALDVSRY
jgi:hypothetical protein